VSVDISPKSNRPEQARTRSDQRIAEHSRKNLKEPEKLKRMIFNNTLKIGASSDQRRKNSREPELAPD